MIGVWDPIAPTLRASSMRCNAVAFAKSGYAAGTPPPAPQQNEYSRMRRISLKLFPAMALRILRGGSKTPFTPRLIFLGGSVYVMHPIVIFSSTSDLMKGSLCLPR